MRYGEHQTCGLQIMMISVVGLAHPPPLHISCQATIEVLLLGSLLGLFFGLLTCRWSASLARLLTRHLDICLSCLCNRSGQLITQRHDNHIGLIASHTVHYSLSIGVLDQGQE